MSAILRPVALLPVTDTNSIVENDIAAIILRNAGTATVKLFSGLYTLDSKETLSLNVTEPGATMDVVIDVLFDTSSGAGKRLEIIIFRKQNC